MTELLSAQVKVFLSSYLGRFKQNCHLVKIGRLVAFPWAHSRYYSYTRGVQQMFDHLRSVFIWSTLHLCLVKSPFYHILWCIQTLTKPQLTQNGVFGNKVMRPFSWNLDPKTMCSPWAHPSHRNRTGSRIVATPGPGVLVSDLNRRRGTSICVQWFLIILKRFFECCTCQGWVDFGE